MWIEDPFKAITVGAVAVTAGFLIIAVVISALSAVI